MRPNGSKSAHQIKLAPGGLANRPSSCQLALALLLSGALLVPTAQAINAVLDLNATYPYLIDHSSGAVIEPRDYMDLENLYAPNETYRATQSAQSRNYHLIKAFDFANYFQSDYWHYSSRDDLVRSAQPVAEPGRCARQLDWLETRLNRSAETLFRPGEQHLNLMTLVDSFGKPEPATYFGHGYWLGSYHECLRTQIQVGALEAEEACESEAVSAGAGGGLSPASRVACLRARQPPGPANLTADNLIRFRYCVAKGRDADWPTREQDNYVPRISYKIGLCLPEACETLSFGRHAPQLERLMRLNLPEYTRARIHLFDMYCVPDERSPIRQLPLAARIFLGLTLAWLAALLAATFVYSCYKRYQKDLRNILHLESVAPAVAVATSCSNPPDGLPLDSGRGRRCCCCCCSTKNGLAKLQPNCCPETINNNNNNNNNNNSGGLAATDSAAKASLLLLQIKTSNGDATQVATAPASNRTATKGADECADPSPVYLHSPGSASSASLSNWLNESPLAIKVLRALSIRETVREFARPPHLLRHSKAANKRLRINLNALDAIKCLCCVLVIFGHIIFIHMQHLSNIVHTIELSYEVYPRALIAFFNFVDTFFIISGMLTAYFIFKRFNRRTFANPLVWLSISLLRLVRLSPVYVLVFWFIKTLGAYITHGPVWDYGTDRNSIKGLCIHDHWWKSLLYLGNWGTMQPLCILPAWSIIVDAQYSLVVPPVIYLLFRNRRLGYAALLAAVLISTTKMSLQLANQTAVKASDMAKMRLHVYPLISRFAAEFYNTAWNRIGPVAIGIIGGHALYLYDVGTIKRWPRFMRDTGFRIILLLHLLIFLLPALGLITDDPASPGDTDMTIFILSNASIKPIWSLINTVFLLRLVTDLRWHSYLAKLMAHNIWHCLGKLCFTSYLIHYEIILTLLKSRQEGLIDPNWSNALREFSAVFVISTLFSYFIYVLYEAPVNKLVMLAFERRVASAGQSSSARKPAATGGALDEPPPATASCKLKSRGPTTTRPGVEYSHLGEPPASAPG